MSNQVQLVRIIKRRFSHHSAAVTAIMVTAIGLVFAQPAQLAGADQSPSGCTGNRFDISIIKDKTQVQQGDTLTYTVTASNTDLSPTLACDITGASIQVTLPALDGTPTGQVVVLATSRDFAAGTPTTLIGTTQYVVSVNANVTDIVAEARAQGTLHDAPVNHSALIVKTIGTSVVTPPPVPPAASGSGAGSGTGTTTPRLPNTGTAPRS